MFNFHTSACFPAWVSKFISMLDGPFVQMWGVRKSNCLDIYVSIIKIEPKVKSLYRSYMTVPSSEPLQSKYGTSGAVAKRFTLLA